MGKRTKYWADYYQRNKPRIRKVQNAYRKRLGLVRKKRRLVPYRPRRRSVWDSFTLEERKLVEKFRHQFSILTAEARRMVIELRRAEPRPQRPLDRADQPPH